MLFRSVRNVSGFIDSEKNWPWDPSYHITIARWLEDQQKTKGWPSEKEISLKLKELRQSYDNSDSRVKIKHDAPNGEGELIGFNRKVGDSIFEAPSDDLAKRVGQAMLPVQSFGLDVHDNPKGTVQWQAEIPAVIQQAEALQKEFNGLAALCPELSSLVGSEESKSKLTSAEESLRTGAVRYEVGARMLKTAITTTAEWWKSNVGWTNAELMQDGRNLVLNTLTQLGEIGRAHV